MRVHMAGIIANVPQLASLSTLHHFRWRGPDELLSTLAVRCRMPPAFQLSRGPARRTGACMRSMTDFDHPMSTMEDKAGQTLTFVRSQTSFQRLPTQTSGPSTEKSIYCSLSDTHLQSSSQGSAGPLATCSRRSLFALWCRRAYYTQCCNLVASSESRGTTLLSRITSAQPSTDPHLQLMRPFLSRTTMPTLPIRAAAMIHCRAKREPSRERAAPCSSDILT